VVADPEGPPAGAVTQRYGIVWRERGTGRGPDAGKTLGIQGVLSRPAKQSALVRALGAASHAYGKEKVYGSIP